MSIRITDECINCGACEPECPNGAIYEPGAEWRISDKTGLSGVFTLKNGEKIDADESMPAISKEYYYVVSDKCTECVGFHDEPQCANACPVDCCIKDDGNPENEDELNAKKEKLHM